MLQQRIFTGQKIPAIKRVEHRFYHTLMADDQNFLTRPFVAHFQEASPGPGLLPPVGFRRRGRQIPNPSPPGGPDLLCSCCCTKGRVSPSQSPQCCSRNLGSKLTGRRSFSVEDSNCCPHSAEITGNNPVPAIIFQGILPRRRFVLCLLRTEGSQPSPGSFSRCSILSGHVAADRKW